jgi:hypothetical protein
MNAAFRAAAIAALFGLSTHFVLGAEQPLVVANRAFLRGPRRAAGGEATRRCNALRGLS